MGGGRAGRLGRRFWAWPASLILMARQGGPLIPALSVKVSVVVAYAVALLLWKRDIKMTFPV